MTGWFVEIVNWKCAIFQVRDFAEYAQEHFGIAEDAKHNTPLINNFNKVKKYYVIYEIKNDRYMS